MVLFPGQTIPVHIFEPRYKQMLQFCTSQNLPFGLVLVQTTARFGRGEPHSIGTLARVIEVEEVAEGACAVPAPHRGNCFNISCRGEDRFRINSVDRREAAYLVADVDLFPDEPVQPQALAMVATRVTELFSEYYRCLISLSGGWQRAPEPEESLLLTDTGVLARGQALLQEKMTAESANEPRMIAVPALPAAPELLANAIAVELNVQPEAKQDLLALPSALARLQKEAELLSQETPQLQERLRSQQRRRYSAFGMSN